MSDVLAFGDSHVFCAAAGGAVARHAGPVTLHRLGRRGEASTLLGEYVGPVLVLAGEIDVRAHVARQLEDRDLEDVIGDLARAASVCLADLGEDAVMCAVIPPAGTGDGPDPPFRGSMAERAVWAGMLNARMADALGARFVDPYAAFRTEEGTLRQGCSDDAVHLADRYGPEAFGGLVEELR